MTATKSIMTVTSAAFFLIFGGGIFLLMNLGSIAKGITEKIATDALGVPVTIGALDISLQDKTAFVKALKIGNPKGFSKPHSMTVDTIEIALDKVSKEIITFKKIAVKGTNVNLEVTPSGTNLSAIQKQIKTMSGANKNTNEAEQPKVIIKTLAITQAKLNPGVVLAGAQDLSSITVPDIHLSRIGQKENGILAHEAIAQIWAHLFDVIGRAAGNAGFYQGMSTDVIKEMGLGTFQQLKDQFKGNIDDFTDEIDEIGTGIKSIFGN